LGERAGPVDPSYAARYETDADSERAAVERYTGEAEGAGITEAETVAAETGR
jgi:hypothetical protein